MKYISKYEIEGYIRVLIIIVAFTAAGATILTAAGIMTLVMVRIWMLVASTLGISFE